MSSAEVTSVLKAVDRAYPGLLQEAPTIDIISVSGTLDTLYVQTPDKNVVNSPSLQRHVESVGKFQHYMLNSSSLSFHALNGKTVATTAHQTSKVSTGVSEDAYVEKSVRKREYDISIAVTTDEWLNKYYPLLKDEALVPTIILDNATWFVDPPLSSRGPAYKVIDNTSVNYPDFMSHYRGVVDKVCARIGKPAREAILGSAVTFSDSFYSMSDKTATKEDYVKGPDIWVTDTLWKTGYTTGTWTVDNKNSLVNRMPCLPGLSRVMITFSIASKESGSRLIAVDVGTYVVGSADMDYHYHEMSLFSGSGTGNHWPVEFVFEGHVGNYLATNNKYPENLFTVRAPIHVMDSLAVNYATLEKSLERDVFDYRHLTSSGTALFGVPNANLALSGEMSVATESVDWGGSLLEVNRVNINATDFKWDLNRDWYREYMSTGYGIYTPRASNIRANVLSEWDALEYDNVVIRANSTPFVTDYTVLTLPEAQSYAKARAKACKTNDWLDQLAISDPAQTWRSVQLKEEAKRNRTFWMSVDSHRTMQNSAVLNFDARIAAAYSRSVDGNIVRTVGAVSTVIDINSDDDLATLLRDRYFNTSSSVVGVTWDSLYKPSAEELTEILDSDFRQSTSVKVSSSVPTIGFGSWVDPHGQSDIENMSEIAKYRLHIKNSLMFDSMSAPLTRVLNSFGFSTLVKYLK